MRVCIQVCRCINLARGQLNREVGGQVFFFFFQNGISPLFIVALVTII